MKLEYRLN